MRTASGGTRQKIGQPCIFHYIALRPDSGHNRRAGLHHFSCHGTNHLRVNGLNAIQHIRIIDRGTEQGDMTGQCLARAGNRFACHHQ